MKKILLATAALSAMTGFAAAEVTTSGEARMGLIYNGDDVEFTSRVRVKFAMMGTTDGGLEFGANIRADQSGQGNTANNDSTVYISGAFGKLTMGDVDTAANALVGNVSGVGLTGLGDWNELGYQGQAKTAVLYQYSSGALTFALSAGQTTAVIQTAGAGTPSTADDVFENDDDYSIAAKYSTDSFSVALGAEKHFNTTQISLGGSATFGAATVKAVVADTDETGRDAFIALSLDYAAGAGTYTVFVTEEDEVNNFGIGAAYDLGGGATAKFGIVRVDGDNFGPTASNETIADVGIAMSF